MSEANLTLAERRYTTAPQLHTHTFYQIIFPRHGELHLTIEGRNGAVGPYGWAVIHPTMAHSFWAAETSCFLVADLPGPVVQSVCAELELPSLSTTIYLRLNESVAALRDLLAGEIAHAGPRPALIVDALSTYTAALLAETLAQPRSRPASPSRTIAERARDYLNTHACEPIRLAEIAAAVGASPSHLQRSFRAAFGKSIVTYLHERRMQTAQHILRTTDLPIYGVAEAVGFASQSAFTRLFQREVGISPSRYRSESGKN
jgi:AraC-like DNA-binding protein